MEYIEFTIIDKHIVCRRSGVIADNTDYMMRFAFDEGWADYPDKTVLVLDNEGKIWELHLTGGATEVKLPKFIGRKLLAVGVTATAGDGEISTDAVSLRVDPSIRTGASEAIGSPESGAMDMLEEYREKCETLIAELQAAIDSTYLGVTDAKIGQTVRITAVDEGGKPTAWEAVDMASGGKYEFIQTIPLTSDVENYVIADLDIYNDVVIMLSKTPTTDGSGSIWLQTMDETGALKNILNVSSSWIKSSAGRLVMTRAGNLITAIEVTTNNNTAARTGALDINYIEIPVRSELKMHIKSSYLVNISEGATLTVYGKK